MNELQWRIENQEFSIIEDLIEIMYDLNIYWSYNEDDEDKMDLEYDLAHHLWETYHSPYIKQKKRNKLNPLKYFLRSKEK